MNLPMAFDAAGIFRSPFLVLRAFFSRAQLRTLLAAVAFLVAWQIIDYLPMFFFNTKNFQAKLERLLDQSRLAISYQGIDVSFFRGVRVIGVRVSFDRDFSRGRYFLQAPAVYIRQSLLFTANESDTPLEKARILIENGQLAYWITAEEADKEFLQQLRGLLQVGKNYHVECSNCRFNLNVKDNSYFQETTTVEQLDFTLRHGGQEIQTLVHYESSAIGYGDFFGRFGACSSLQCDDLEGYWYFKPSRLQLSVFNNFQKDFEIASGSASGELAFDRRIVGVAKKEKGKEVIVKEAFSNFRMSVSTGSLRLSKKKQTWYETETLSIDTKMQINAGSSTGYARARIDSYDLKAEFANLRPDGLPESYFFQIVPTAFSSKKLNLPANQTITGLEEFSINLRERKGNKYADTAIILKMNNGKFIVGKAVPPLQLPFVEIILRDEKIAGKVRAMVGNSQLEAELAGALELYPVQYVPLKTVLLRELADAVERTIFTLRGKVSGYLKSDKVNWSDAKPFVDFWLRGYWQEVAEGIQYSWLPSRLRRREYFVRFIQYLDFSLSIDIKSFDWGPQMPLKGSLYFSPLYGGGAFKLESADGKNSTALTVSYGSNEPNAPYMSHNLVLNLENAYSLLAPWFGTDYFEHFSSAQILHSDNFMGERPADHYLKSTSVTEIRLTQVRLGRWAQAQALPLQWETVEVRANRSNGYGTISSVRAENDNTILSGYGEYRLFNRQLETTLKYNVMTR